MADYVLRDLTSTWSRGYSATARGAVGMAGQSSTSASQSHRCFRPGQARGKDQQISPQTPLSCGRILPNGAPEHVSADREHEHGHDED